MPLERKDAPFGRGGTQRHEGSNMTDESHAAHDNGLCREYCPALLNISSVMNQTATLVRKLESIDTRLEEIKESNSEILSTAKFIRKTQDEHQLMLHGVPGDATNPGLDKRVTSLEGYNCLYRFALGAVWSLVGAILIALAVQWILGTGPVADAAASGLHSPVPLGVR